VAESARWSTKTVLDAVDRSELNKYEAKRLLGWSRL